MKEANSVNVYMFPEGNVHIEILGDMCSTVLYPDKKRGVPDVARNRVTTGLRGALPTHKMIVVFPIEWSESVEPLSSMNVLTGRIRWGRITKVEA